MKINRPSPFARGFLNQPLALAPAYLAAALALSPDGIADDGSRCGYEVVSGVAIIQVSGLLVDRLGSVYSWGSITGYDGIRFNIAHALANQQVQGICLLVASGGGLVTGCFDLVDFIFNVRGHKPMWAVLSEHAYSAAYAIASACDRITVPRTGGTGSVGVICAHVDFSKYLEEIGMDVTLFTYGAHKADGNPYGPLPADVVERIQADVDRMGDLFVDTVARNRAIDRASVKKTEASTYMGALGVDVGFADAVMAPDEAFRALLTELG
jgi:ClpP class serine protease